ncbi:MAG TPA: cytochrome P460 family protein [Candidatus Limnocylindrales bacterium]|nr:cytochrome P460 family protein [Candidatus Limnocylindrales bacterium]
MRRIAGRHLLLTGFAVLASVLLAGGGDAGEKAAAPAAPAASPIFGVTIPDGYRNWQLISVSHRTDNKDELRAVLGNDIAMKAFRENKLPFPDGSMMAKLAWKREPMKEFAGAWIPGVAPRIEFMVKDSKKYSSTGGWGFGRFVDGKPADEATHKTCFPCHEANVKGHDWVFTRYAP